jgi:Domain of unknown function (DUF4861)
VAYVLTTPVIQMMVKQGHLLVETLVKKNEPLVYYHGAAWDKAGKIILAKDWFKYLQTFQNSIKNPISISIK